MPKKPVRASANALTGAAALIAEASAAARTEDPSEAAMAELVKILAHNDASPRARRVPSEKAIALLQSLGWKHGSKDALRDLCVRRLGRRSYALA